VVFRHQIETLSGQNTNLCFQCSKCASGCPLVEEMDLNPAQVMHSIRLGREEALLKSRAIWLCISCEACASRCPQGVHPAAAMNAARVLARRQGIRPAVREIGIYYKGFVDNMRLNGMIHDTSVAGITQLLTGQIRANLPLAWKLWVRGRLRLPPLPFGGGRFRRIYKRAVSKDQRSTFDP
jgi:heterodisulfide reductase subunit C2